ncbi:hypothetical protein Tco_0494651 [Tanacetum coccineum]
MVHNYYLEEAKKNAQLKKDKALNSKPSVITPARLPNTTSGSKPKPRNEKQQTRNWPPSLSSQVTNKVVHIAEKPWNQKPFLKSKDLGCPTCKKFIYTANHDACILKYLSEVDSRASTQKSRIFTYVGLRWIPTRKIVETCINTNDSDLPLGKETCTPNTVICANSSSLSADTSMASEPISSKGLTNTKEGKVDTSKELDASLVDTKRSGTDFENQYTSSRSGNDADADADNAYIKLVYDEEPMAEVQLTVELKVLKEKSNKAKVKHDIDVIEIINIELEHKVAKLLKENETLKKHYKELWIPTGKIFESSTTKVDSEPTNGSNKDITNQYECEKTLDVSARLLLLKGRYSSILNRRDQSLVAEKDLYLTNQGSSRI